MDIFEKIASDMNQDIRNSGGTSNITGETVKNTIKLAWDEARENEKNNSYDNNVYVNEEVYSPSPTQQNLEQRIEDVANQSKQALWQAKTALREAKEAQKKSKQIETIVIVLFIAIALAFIWRLYTSIISVQEATHTFYQRGIELEKKITKYDEKIKILEEKQQDLEKSLDSKIMAEINKKIVEFLIKDKQIKITE